MYKQLTYTPSKILQCKYTGHIALITYADDGLTGPRDGYSFLHLYDANLTEVECFSIDAMNRSMYGIVAISVESTDLILVEAHPHDGCSFGDEVINYDLHTWKFPGVYLPDSAIVISEVPCSALMIEQILYRVPSELSVFVKLPKMQLHNFKMIECAWVLSHHVDILDIIMVIVVTSTQVCHKIDYAQYCEERMH